MQKTRETPLEMARRHVHESEARVQRQRAIVIRAQSLDDALHTEAESLLAVLENVLQQYKAQLARFESER